MDTAISGGPLDPAHRPAGLERLRFRCSSQSRHLLTSPGRSRDECGTNDGQASRTRGAIVGDALCRTHGRCLVLSPTRTGSGGHRRRTCSEPGSNETGLCDIGLSGTRCLVGAITRRCRGRRPGRTRRIGSCSSDLSRRGDARHRARPPRSHRWRTSSRHLGLHTSRTSAPPSLPSLDHPFGSRDRTQAASPSRRTAACASSAAARLDDAPQGHERADHEDHHREVDQPQVAERIEAVRVVRRQGHREP